MVVCGGPVVGLSQETNFESEDEDKNVNFPDLETNCVSNEKVSAYSKIQPLVKEFTGYLDELGEEETTNFVLLVKREMAKAKLALMKNGIHKNGESPVGETVSSCLETETKRKTHGTSHYGPGRSAKYHKKDNKYSN